MYHHVAGDVAGVSERTTQVVVDVLGEIVERNDVCAG